MTTSLSIDQKAPTFTTLNHLGETVSLSDFEGKNVLLYFYPKAMTPGCTVQACGIRDTQVQFEKANTVVLGISPDAPARLQKFVDKEGLNFMLLADEDNAIAKQYGVWALKKFMGKEFMGVVRTSFLIDQHGVLKHVIDKVKTKTHHEQAMAAIEEYL